MFTGIQNEAGMNAAELQQSVRSFVESLKKEACGSMMWERLCSFLLDNVMPVVFRRAGDARMEAERRISEAQIHLARHRFITVCDGPAL